MLYFVCLSLEMSIQLFFFRSLFSGYFCSNDASVVCIVSCACNQSPSVLFMLSSRHSINASKLSKMLAWHLFLFHDTQRQSRSSLGSKVLYIVISFLVLKSIYGSSLLHVKNGPEYYTKGTGQVFILLMRFLLCSLVLRSFLAFPEVFILLIFFFHFRFRNDVRFQYS